MRGLLAPALACAALLAAGCGGSSSSGGDATDTASLAPKNAAVWMSIDTDTSSGQWKSLDTLLAKIPGVQTALDNAGSSSFGGGSLRTDVLPALGPRLVLVVPAGSSQPIELVKPSDPAELDALLAKTSEREVTGEVDGWTAIAATRKDLRAYETALAGGTLEGSDAFTSATAGLPDEALAVGFVDGKGLSTGLNGLTSAAGLSGLSGVTTAAAGASSLFRTPSSNGSGSCTVTVNGHTLSCSSVGMGQAGSLGAALPANAADLLRSIGFAVDVTGDTIHFEATLDVPQGQAPPAYAPTLLDKVPADALVAVSFHGGQTLTEQLGSNAAALTTLEQQLGVPLDDLARSLEGEGVLYVRPAPLIPEITLAVQSSDPAATKGVFDAIVGKVAGAAAKNLPIPGFELTTTTVGDVVVVSTSKTAAGSFGTGPGLSSNDRFESAADAVRLGDTTSGFAYVDVGELAPLVQAAAGLIGDSSRSGTDDAVKALSSLDFLALNAVTEDGHVRVEGALRTS